MPAPIALDILGGLLALAFFKLLGGAGLGAALVSAISEALGQSRKKAFLDKFGQQAAAMGFKALAASLAGTACGLVFLASRRSLNYKALAASDPTLALGAVLALLALSLTAYALSWKKMRQNKGVHQALGWLAAALVPALLGLAVVQAGQGPSLAALFRPGAETALPPSQTLLAPALAAPVALAALAWCLCAAGGLALLYLLHRRERDDFGRDYYQFALRAAARWALGGLAASVACGAWLAMSLAPATRTQFLGQIPALAVLGGAILACGAAWAATSASRNPLTLKWLLGLGGLALWAAHGAVMFLVLALA